MKTVPAMKDGATGESSTKSTKEKGLMFVDVKINEKPIRAIVDMGATHNYLASTEVERLGLVLEKGVGQVKAINSAIQPITGVVKSVLIKLRPYEGRTNLSVMAMMPHAGALMMMGNKPCVAQTMSSKTSSKPLFAMQFIKGYRKNEPSFLCTLQIEDIKENSGKIPEAVKRILWEFENVMPDELPKKLLPKRVADHEIEMVSGTKPYALALYPINHVADALSRRTDLDNPQLVAALASSKATTNLKDKIRELTKEDPTAQDLLNLVEQKKTQNFWLEEGPLKMKKNRLYVLKGGDLRRSIITECHDTLWVGHPGEERTQDKVDRHKKVGLLEPFSIPSRPWDSVSMDFITCLPKVGDLDAIVVVVDRFLKYATFVPAPKTIIAEETAQLFFKHIVNANQKDWMKLLDAVQLCFNAQKCSTTNGTPYEICIGQQPLLPHSIDAPQGARVSSAHGFSLEWKQNLDLAGSYLKKAQKLMKKYADQKCRFIEYRVGGQIMVKVLDQRLSKTSRWRDVHLMPKYIGPLIVLQRIEKVTYRVELPPWLRIHNAIHLRLVNNTGKRIAEAILYHRDTGKRKKLHREYLVKWTRCTEE
ncbi:hypothetical protein C2S52_015434 [Perilla frutescens var. hirtella]|nr:hypothetical protein C2S52_015434 [Perilla frutescens var. hirtella]